MGLDAISLFFEVSMDPFIFRGDNFVLSWHGFLSVVAVIVAVYLVGRWAPKNGIDPDDVYSIATWAILGGIIGARLVHVVDDLSYYTNNPVQIFAVWKGGIAIWGAVLGGFAGGWIYASIRSFPKARIADLAAPALAFGMGIGRIGDIINGEHLAKLTMKPWGIVWSHPDSLSYQKWGLNPSHPAVAYEMLLDLGIGFLLIFFFRKRIRPDGMLFPVLLVSYSFFRFFILFFHDYPIIVLGLNQAQVICLIVLVVTVPILFLKANFIAPAEPEPLNEHPMTRSERRRRKD